MVSKPVPVLVLGDILFWSVVFMHYFNFVIWYYNLTFHFIEEMNNGSYVYHVTVKGSLSKCNTASLSSQRYRLWKRRLTTEITFAIVVLYDQRIRHKSPTYFHTFSPVFKCHHCSPKVWENLLKSAASLLQQSSPAFGGAHAKRPRAPVPAPGICIYLYVPLIWIRLEQISLDKCALYKRPFSWLYYHPGDMNLKHWCPIYHSPIINSMTIFSV